MRHPLTVGLELIAIAAYLVALSRAINKPVCYTPYLNEDPTSIPCNASAEVSTCCAPNNICLSNGLCAPNVTLPQGNPQYYTSLCTDSNWQSPECMKICKNNITSLSPLQPRTRADTIFLDPVNGQGLRPCGNGDFCCWDEADNCCSTSSLVFFLGKATGVATLPGAYTTSVSSSSTAGTTARPTIKSQPVPSPIPASSAPAPAIATSFHNHGSNNHVAIGVGVGIGVAAAASITGAVIYFLMRRKSRAVKNQAPHAVSYEKPMQELSTPSYIPVLQEVSGDSFRGELVGYHQAHELD